MTEDENKIWCWYTRKPIGDDQPCICCKKFDRCYVSREGFNICQEASADPSDQEAQIIWDEIRWALHNKQWMDLPINP